MTSICAPVAVCRPSDVVKAEPTVLVECWGTDESIAWALAARSHARLRAAAGSVVRGLPVYRVEATLPNNNPDVNRPALTRYQFVATVHTRAVPMEV